MTTYRLGKAEFYIPKEFQAHQFRQIWDPEQVIGRKGSFLESQLRVIMKRTEKLTEDYIRVLTPIYRYVTAGKRCKRQDRLQSTFERATNKIQQQQELQFSLQPFTCLCCKTIFWEVQGTRLWLSICFGCQIKMNVPEYMRKGPPNVMSEHKVSCQTHGCVWSVHAQPFFHHVWLDKYQQTLANNPFL